MIKEFLKLMRVTQWIKNIFLFVPLVFSKHLFHHGYFEITVQAFLVFCFISSVVYTVNDIVDIKSDKLHPKKKFRPIASGKISKNNAFLLASVLLIISISFSWSLNHSFAYLAFGYLLLNVFYSFIFKHIVLLDIFSIAAGFMIRVAAGAVVINVELSSWLILTTLFLSLFLAIMKRRSELSLKVNESEISTRKVLEHYTVGFIDQMATITGSGVIICYALYTVAERTVTIFRTENLIYTTVFVVFGVFRYMYIVIKNNKGENTTEDLLTDFPMILNSLLYGIVTILIVYHIF